MLLNGLKTDPELVFHIGMTPKKFPDLVVNNKDVAYIPLILLT